MPLKMMVKSFKKTQPSSFAQGTRLWEHQVSETSSSPSSQNVPPPSRPSNLSVIVGEDEPSTCQELYQKYCHGFLHTFEYCLCVSTVRIHRHLANSGIMVGGAPSFSRGVMCVCMCAHTCLGAGQGRPVTTLSEQLLLCSLS